MITEGIIDVLAGLVNFITGLIPTTPPPGWVSTGDGLLASVWASAAGLGAWIPWGLLATVVTTVLACVGIGFLIKVVRIVASFFLAGGGSAA